MRTQDTEQAENRLRESEARFRSLFETMVQGVVYQDAQGAITSANPAAQRILGLTLDQMQGLNSIDPHWRAIHEDGAPFPGETHPAMVALRTGQPVTDVLIGIYIAAENRHRWLNSNAVPLFRPGETVPYQVYTTFEDVTEHKQAEEAVHSRERQLQALVSSLDDIVFEVDADGTYLNVWTADDARLFRPRTEIIGKRFDEVFGAEASRPFFEFLARTLASDTSQTLEYSLELGGTEHWFAAHYNPIHAPGSARNTVSITVRDITERKQAQALLYAQRDLARAVGTFETVAAGFRAILATVLRVSGMDSGAIYLFSPDGRWLELAQHQGLSAEFVQAVGSYPLDTRNSSLVLTGKPLYFSHDDPMVRDSTVRAEGLRSLASVPILYQERVIGCFNLASHVQDEIPPFARQVLETLAVEVGNFVVHLQAQEALRQSEERYRSLAEASDAIIVLLDADGRVHYVNERATATHDTPAWRVGDVVGKTLQDFTPPLAELYLSHVRQVIAADQSMLLESPIGPNVYRVSIQPIHDEGGNAVMAMLSATDITALKQTQKELQELNRVLEERVAERTAEVQDLYDNAPAGYHSLDANGCFIRINQTELDWLGYTREELIGRPVTEITTAATQAIHREDLPRLKQHGYVRDVEVELIRKDGSTVPMLLNATAIYDEHGSFVASRSTLIDNTERKRADQALRKSEETLRQANAEMARALRMKDEFLANMSHELRTPLHGILAMTETLLDQIRGPLNERQQKSVGLIEESGRHLLTLINDLLDLSKIEAGKLELHFESLLVDDMCGAGLQFVRTMALKKEIQVEYANPSPGTRLSADAQRLKQMLVNLLSNAVKFTPNGGQVRLDVALDATAGLIHFAIQDTGPGIAPADQSRLFQPFVQLDSQLARQYEGTGLGLALVKRLAEQHGGTVRLDSTGIPGEGCCFTITLPYTPAPPPAAADAAQPDLAVAWDAAGTESGPLLLLAEDNEVSIAAVEEYMRHAGCRIAVARTGIEALALAADITPDLILMDVQLPLLDGLEVTRRLRAQPRFAATPIIAVTASAMPGDRERCLAAGATGYLSKPLRLKELLALVRELVAPAAEGKRADP